MKQLKTEKLHVRFLAGTSPEGPIMPRRYTLTHSDRTGDLYLTIGANYDRKQISGWYTKIMRDEVLGEWHKDVTGYQLKIYVHVSGGWVVGTAKWRSKILHKEMPLVLESISYADKTLLHHHPELSAATIQVHFQSNLKKYNQIENWPPVFRLT